MDKVTNFKHLIRTLRTKKYDRILLKLKKSSDSQKVAKAIIDLTWEAAAEKT